MNDLSSKFDQLQERLQGAAFLVSQGSAKEAHSELFRCTALLSEIRQLCSAAVEQPSSPPFTDMTLHDAEVKKVRNRLRLWAKRQNQINSRILNIFLRLEKLGTVTESALAKEFGDLATFISNFNQMKTISERNHGKVFDQVGDAVTLWAPIVPYVRDYESERQK